MIRRLIIFIIIFAVFLTFITFNLENRCNISFGFTELENVPVFLTVFISVIAGFLCSLPLIFRAGKKSISRKSKVQAPKEESPPSYSGGKYFTKKNKTKDGDDDSL